MSYPVQTFDQRLEAWKNMMKAKFIKRINKHPGELSVTSNKFDWEREIGNISNVEAHLFGEVAEYFNIKTHHIIEMWETILKDRNKDGEITRDVTELVDISNLSFVVGQTTYQLQLPRCYNCNRVLDAEGFCPAWTWTSSGSPHTEGNKGG